jgi:hypothetical protein
MQENNEIWNEGEFFNSKNDEENNCATKSWVRASLRSWVRSYMERIVDYIINKR